MSARLARLLPESTRRLLFAWRQPLARRVYAGTRYYCPVCDSHVRALLPHGRPPRPAARCPVCGALERHRLCWPFLRDRTDLFAPTPRRMLHVAPERVLERAFRRLRHVFYVTADLRSPRVAVKMDVAGIPCADQSFDTIYCSHVLEHVTDDRRAMREFHRVLAPQGWAVIVVPLTVGQTLEDATVVDAAGRTRVYGHPDHVRRYGPDCRERLRAAGFAVSAYTADDAGDTRQTARLGLRRDEVIYYCTR
jgi:SAM-dependent methyltransferase